MKKLNIKIKGMRILLLQLSILFFLASCSNFDETTFNDEEEGGEGVLLTDAWICDMKSYEEDHWYYEMYLDANGDYIAVSDKRILKVNKDGVLNSMILITYPDDDPYRLKIYNDKIYRFHYDNDFQDFDPNQPIELQIYDFDFNLLSEHELDSKGLIYDVEIENDNMFGMLVYNPDASVMTLKKLHLNNGLISEIILSTSGTNPTNLHIADSGNYFCTASSTRDNFYLLDNDLNLIWANEYDEYTISDAKFIEGQGIYFTGGVSPFVNPDRPSYVALIDLDGNKVNSVEFDPGERWSPQMQINQDRICLTQTEPESGKNMLMSILDFNLNIESTLEIPGNYVRSRIIVNELGSFSFVYGIALDPNDPDVFPLSNNRIFKFDSTYDLPTNIIVQ